jgi:two-component SAPR family response regulator
VEGNVAADAAPNGPVLAQRMVERRPSMRVLYVSGYTEALSVASGCERIRVVRKPFTADALASAVRQALDAN